MDLTINVFLTKNPVKFSITENILNSRDVAASCFQASTSAFDRGNTGSEAVPWRRVGKLIIIITIALGVDIGIWIGGAVKLNQGAVILPFSQVHGRNRRMDSGTRSRFYNFFVVITTTKRGTWICISLLITIMHVRAYLDC
jgi:hypothetical protein